MNESATNQFFANIRTGDCLTLGPFKIYVEKVKGRRRLRIEKPAGTHVTHRREESDLTNTPQNANNSAAKVRLFYC